MIQVCSFITGCCSTFPTGFKTKSPLGGRIIDPQWSATGRNSCNAQHQQEVSSRKHREENGTSKSYEFCQVCNQTEDNFIQVMTLKMDMGTAAEEWVGMGGGGHQDVKSIVCPTMKRLSQQESCGSINGGINIWEQNADVSVSERGCVCVFVSTAPDKT